VTQETFFGIMDSDSWPSRAGPQQIAGGDFHYSHRAYPPPPILFPLIPSSANDRGNGQGDDDQWNPNARTQFISRKDAERRRVPISPLLNGLKKFGKAIRRRKNFTGEGRWDARRGLAGAVDSNSVPFQSDAVVTPYLVGGPSEPDSLVPQPNHDRRIPPSHGHQDNETASAAHEYFPLSSRISNPVAAELRPSADYAKMGSPASKLQDLPLSIYATRLREFLKDVYNLPWIASRPTADYYPPQPGTRAPAEPLSPINWYALLHRKPVDLLSSGSSSSPDSPDAPLSYHPNLVYGYEAPAGAGRDPTSTMAPEHPPLYPREYYLPQPVYIDTRPPIRHVPLNAVQIYGPPVPHITGHQHPYPTPWPPARRTSQRN
jgi:hypothetical protein